MLSILYLLVTNSGSPVSCRPQLCAAYHHTDAAPERIIWTQVSVPVWVHSVCRLVISIIVQEQWCLTPSEPPQPHSNNGRAKLQ